MNIVEFQGQLIKAPMEPLVRSACLELTKVLDRIRPGDGKHLSIPFFYNSLTTEHKQVVLQALSILTTWKGALLQMHAYIDDASDGQIHIEDEDFARFVRTGELVNPISGELVNQPQDHVRIYYSLRDA